ncbi:hypothetical protein ScPMuIL_017933 [Solemya velum]
MEISCNIAEEINTFSSERDTREKTEDMARQKIFIVVILSCSCLEGASFRSRLDDLMEETRELTYDYQKLDARLQHIEDQSVNLQGASSTPDQGWEMVFRGMRGNGESIYDAWQSSGTNSPFFDGCMNYYSYPLKHYRSFRIDEWDSLNIREIKPGQSVLVKVELFKDDARVAYVVFDGIGSDMFNWFNDSRILDSGWSDLLAVNGTYNYFSLLGHSGKTFFINKLYGGCPADEGWLMIEEDDSHPCSYDKQPSYPAFVYAPGPTSTIWETKHEVADIMVVSIKNSP